MGDSANLLAAPRLSNMSWALSCTPDGAHMRVQAHDSKCSTASAKTVLAGVLLACCSDSRSCRAPRPLYLVFWLPCTVALLLSGGLVG